MTDKDLALWTNALGGPTKVRPGNAVTSLVDGPATFLAMYEAILTARRPGHYIYLLGWWLDRFVSLTGEPSRAAGAFSLPVIPETSITGLFEKAGKSGVQIRAMLWDQKSPSTKNTDAIDWLNRVVAAPSGYKVVPNGAGILDNRTLPLEPTIKRQGAALGQPLTVDLPLGSHHQKVLLVRGERGLIAFCGGVDINEDRVNQVERSPGSPYHDVHCRIEGPAAHDLADVFVQRWLAHPDHCRIDNEQGPLLGLADRDARRRPITGAQFVSIARTANFVDADSNSCSLERSVSTTIVGAIHAATRFIYIEDQYLVNMDAAKELRLALEHLQHLTIVIPHSSIVTDLHGHIWEKRAEFIEELRKAKDASRKVRVFCRTTAGSRRFGPHSYVHAKVWIFDDQVAIIGSANCNNRGWFFDSEVLAAVFDQPPSADKYSFAQELRVKLWKEHLGIEDAKATSLAFGWGEGANDLWLKVKSNANARVQPYDPYESQDQGIETLVPWALVDPKADTLPVCGEFKGAARCT